MGELRRHKHGLAWLGIVALLGNVLVGAFCHAASKTTALADDLLGPLVICTSEGAKTLPHGGSAPQPHQERVDHCAICSLLAGLSIAVALVFAAIAFELLSVARPVQAGLRTLADHLSLGGIRSRAPPLSA